MTGQSQVRVLVIEDIPDLVKRMRILLENQGYTVDTATNGEDGMKLARANKPDIVCLDLTMPKVSGFEVCEQIRADATLKDTPVLIISARSTPDARAQSREVGANAFLVKPFKQKELFEAINKLVKK